MFLPQELLLDLEEVVNDVGILGHRIFRVQESTTDLDQDVNGFLEYLIKFLDLAVFFEAEFQGVNVCGTRMGRELSDDSSQEVHQIILEKCWNQSNAMFD